nr:Kv channel-interacting protein 4-like [Rhipicephalus microplus]
MYQGFKQVCPTGVVHENTFKEIYAQFFPHGDVSQYAHYLFQAFDQDHNGTITFQDFVVGLSALSRGAPVDKLRWAFQLYDLNGDGIISRDEMTDVIVSIHSLVGAPHHQPDDDDPDSVRDHANRVFQKLDLNQDGVVTIDEFIETCLKDENVMKSLAILDTVL